MKLENTFEQLNPMQRKAVETTEGPLLVLAGAGSGKTRALTHRIAYLIEEKGVNPWNILAITFTNKAAGEMRDRVDRLVSFGAESIWVSTFHSACVRILRRHVEGLGYTANFTIYDTDDQKALMRQLLKQMDMDPKVYREKAVLSFISSQKNEMISPEEFSAKAAGNFRESQMAEIYGAYQEELKKNNAMDFDDLLVKTVELLQNDKDVREYYQNRFQYIMVDEYQDTNHVQFKLIQILADKYRNLCVVGDDDQSIYQFRGADIRNILEFETEYPGAQVIRLEQNYRSTKMILEAANQIIRNNEGRKEKQLWTENETGEKLRANVYETGEDEAEAVASEVASLNTPYRDIAVLYRTNAQSRVLEEHFVHKNIPYQIVGGVNFYQRKEIKDILAYLKTIDSGRDDLAVQRIINVPRRGIGATSIGKIINFAAAHNLRFYEALKEGYLIGTLGKTQKKTDDFVELIEKLRQQAEDLELPDLIEAVLRDTGYEDELKNDDAVTVQARMENIQELVNKAADFSSQAKDKEGLLGQFLEEVALVADIDRTNADEDRVLLMTLHSAKGLEFPRVYITGMEDGLFPSGKAVNAEDDSLVEEERRLAYVGVTRAKENLILTWSRRRMVNGESRWCKPSRFLEEIPEELLEQNQSSAWPFRQGNMDMTQQQTFRQQASQQQPSQPQPSQQQSANGGKRSPYSAPKAVFGEDAYTRNIGKQFTVTKADSLDYQTGDRIRHMKYGEGTVTAVVDGKKDYEVTVNFDRVGQKKMFASFAKLEKI